KTIEMEESDMCEALEQFRNKAIAEGMAQGISQGEAKGRAIGKLEEKEKTVLKLQIKGMDIKDIAEVVECSISQVKEWLSKSNDCLV
ncbi:sigma factor-like helix-turn-helix DNA-binding protein, partial [Floccifex sp.]|uniref:sigma factor-like helix-turn-helix DNA-binding protein n=1 Tax=Floccifex sp. TaxID=2815810 RepID=UPI003F0837AC